MSEDESNPSSDIDVDMEGYESFLYIITCNKSCVCIVSVKIPKYNKKYLQTNFNYIW